MIEKISAGLKFISTTLIYIIYPPICPICNEIVDERNELCPSCAKKILRLDLNRESPNVMRITKYRGGTRELLRKLKFDNNLAVLPALQKILAAISNREEIKNFIANIDVATFVPLHQKRLKERGYNQTELIFRDWLIAQNLTAENLLARIKSTPKLYKYNPTKRREILSGAFELIDGVKVAGKNILVIDDIYTTGATVSECARILKNAGAAKIFVMAFASDFGD